MHDAHERALAQLPLPSAACCVGVAEPARLLPTGLGRAPISLPGCAERLRG
jgi:hypothetical protein